MESQWRVRKKVDSQEITSASSSLFQFAHVGISTCCCSPARVGDEKKLNAFDDWDISEILYLKSIYYPNEISENLQICKFAKIGPVQVGGFPRQYQPRLRVRGPLKISYRSLKWVVLLNGENTSNYITLTFASSCFFCIN